MIDIVFFSLEQYFLNLFVLVHVKNNGFYYDIDTNIHHCVLDMFTFLTL